MNTRLITQAEIDQHQRQVQHMAHRARNQMTIAGIRQLFGNTFIALGTRLYGCMDHKRETIVVPPNAVPARGI